MRLTIHRLCCDQAATQTIKRLDTLGMLVGLNFEEPMQEMLKFIKRLEHTIIYYTDGFTDAPILAIALMKEI